MYIYIYKKKINCFFSPEKKLFNVRRYKKLTSLCKGRLLEFLFKCLLKLHLFQFFLLESPYAEVYKDFFCLS